MMLHYFLQARWSTRKTLVIFQVTRQVSPDFYLFHNFWKQKKSQVSPTPQNQTFGFWYNVTFFNYMSTKTQFLNFLNFLPHKYFFQ